MPKSDDEMEMSTGTSWLWDRGGIVPIIFVPATLAVLIMAVDASHRYGPSVICTSAATPPSRVTR